MSGLKNELQRKPKTQTASLVKLLCKECKKKCKTIICLGSDIFTLEDESHHTVHKAKIQSEFYKEIYAKPVYISNTLLLTHKMFCSLCKKQWGDVCMSTSDKQQYHLLKCKAFLYEVEDSRANPAKSWDEVKFPIEPLSSKE